MNKLRKGDEVIVLTGRDKGKRGTISEIRAERQKCGFQNSGFWMPLRIRRGILK